MQGIRLYDTGASPSGKAAGFDPAMRWFESSRPCHNLSEGRVSGSTFDLRHRGVAKR
ncbi:hypothetical protein OF001_U80043 [Pseudomonas sp. OF001]|nr:hypothetical protein OF001_U80043 [Pseudomonas sp. OF001]